MNKYSIYLILLSVFYIYVEPGKSVKYLYKYGTNFSNLVNCKYIYLYTTPFSFMDRFPVAFSDNLKLKFDKY